jgi:hypothetical protein
MPKVNVDHECKLSVDDAFSKIKNFFENDQDIRRLDPKMECTFADSAKTGKAKGSKFNADIAVKSHGAGSKIQIVVDLPLVLTPFKGKVQETIQKKLAKYLG